MENPKVQLRLEGNSASTSNCHHVSQLPHSYAVSKVINRFMASSDVSPSNLPGPPWTKITEENIDRVRNLVEEKPNSSISLLTPTSNSLSDLVNTVERYDAKDQIITAVNHILPRAQACIESDGGYLSTNWNSSRKDLIDNFVLPYIFSLKWPTLGSTNNIIITI